MGRGYLFEPSDGDTTVVSYVAIGDSFTEGLNDSLPDGGFRGWADRLAGMIAAARPRARYANLAIRGKLLRQIVSDQVPAAVELLSNGTADGASAADGASGGAPEGVKLVSLAAGGNDILRPGADPDSLAELFDSAVAMLRDAGSEVMIFTGFDPKAFPLMRLLRGRIAAYNMHLRAIADTRDCYLVDLWSMRYLHQPSAWSTDRIHLTPESHQRVALRACEVLGVPVAEDWKEASAATVPGSAVPGSAVPGSVVPGSVVPGSVVPAVPARAAWLAARREDAVWAKEYFGPWINRRLHGTSSGDGLSPKRPALEPVAPIVTL